MSFQDQAVYPVSDASKRSTLVDAERYGAMYRQSITDSDAFWRQEAGRLDWMAPFTQVEDVSWDKDDLHIR